MNRKETGIILAVLGAVLILVSISFTMEFMARGLELHETCPLDPQVCPFIEIPWQGIFSVGIGIVMIVLGILTFRKPFAETRAPDIEMARKKLGELSGDEREIYQLLIEEKGMIFQSKLIGKTGYSKVKISRVLDILENKGLVERKRRGMTNVVVLKQF